MKCSNVGQDRRIKHGLIGFTLLEVLVVIYIVFVIISLTLPAVQWARESSRNTTCREHLRQLGMALHQYSEAHQCFPPAGIWAPAGVEITAAGAIILPGAVDLTGNSSSGWTKDRFYGSAFRSLLCYVEQHSVDSSWNIDVPISAPANWTCRGATISSFLCPTDPFNSEMCSLQAGNWARGNYGLNAGPNADCLAESFVEPPELAVMLLCKNRRPDLTLNAGVRIVPPISSQAREVVTWGVGGVNRGARISDVLDGLSNTVAFDELRAGLSSVDRRGCWGMPSVGSSVTFGHGQYAPTAVGPNDCKQTSDSIQDCVVADREQCMPCLNDEVSQRATARSCHPGTVNVLHADGSAHAVDDKISIEVWTSRHTIAGADDFSP